MEHEGESIETGSHNELFKLFPIFCFNFSGLVDLFLGWKKNPMLIENEG